MTERLPSAKLMASFALERLSPRVRTDVLDGGEIAARYDLGITRSLALRENLSVYRDDLFKALRSVTGGAAQASIKVRPADDEADVSINGDGVAVIKLGETRFLFDNPELAAPSRAVRLAAFEQLAAKDTLSVKQEEQLRVALSKEDYDVDEFEKINEMVGKAPATFLARLSEGLNGGRLSFSDFVPADRVYWDAILPVPQNSTTQTAYIGDELQKEWEGRLSLRSPGRAYSSIAKTFGAPALVPIELLRGLSETALLEIANEARSFIDPFAVVGTIAFCAELSVDHPRLAPHGLALLRKLVENLPDLENAFHVYSAGLVSATSFLAQHDELSSRPSFWRRMAAATHASLVVEAAGSYQERDHLLEWAWGHSGMEFTLAVTNELPDLPRWLPDWSQPDHLLADMLGRITTLTTSISAGKISEEWRTPLNAVQAFADGNAIGIYANYPAVLEGDMPVRDRTLESFGPHKKYFEEANANPTLENFLVLQPLLFGWGMPPNIDAIAASALIVAEKAAGGFDDHLVRKSIEFASIIAIQLESKSLADRVSDLVLRLTPKMVEQPSAFEAVLAIMKCSYAGVGPAEGKALAASRLETLAAHLTRSELSWTVHSALVKLRKCDRLYCKELGRALAIAGLGLFSRASVS